MSWKHWANMIVSSGLLLPCAMAGVSETTEQQGVSVTLSIERPSNDAKNMNAPLSAGEPLLVQFHVEDNSHSPLSGLYPAAWIHPSDADNARTPEQCLSKVKAFIGGSLLSRAEIDLNVYYVLTLNQDASISVVDPLFGFGGSKLLTMLPLHSVGYDWAVADKANKVFVSLPATNEIAAIDTLAWQVGHLRSNGQWTKPTKVALPAGQPYLWTLVEQGVAVFNPKPLALTKLIATCNSPSAIAFSGDGRFAYLLNKTTVDVIDTLSFAIIQSIGLGENPTAMAYSGLAKELYITHANTGEIWAIDEQHRIVKKLQSEPGIAALQFEPNGRWGFLLNPSTNRLSVIDAARHKIVQTGRVEQEPESISFSDRLAYIRHKGSANLLMIALDDANLGKENTAIPVIDTPGGDQSPGLIDTPSGADGIVQVPTGSAVLVSNYRDQAVYFYKEGMAAPMGQFNNYGKSPRAVLAIDHSLTEKAAGSYSTSATIPKAGHYQAVYFMDSPRILHCFNFNVAPAANETSLTSLPTILVSEDNEQDIFKTGDKARLQFIARIDDTDSPVQNQPFNVDILLTSGLWRQQVSGISNGNGEIAVEFTPPLPGMYDVYVSSPNKRYPLAKQTFSYEAIR